MQDVTPKVVAMAVNTVMLGSPADDLVSPYDISDAIVVGVLFDRDACGYATVKHTVSNTPLNAAGLFYNTYYHFTDKYWVANEENCVVFLLD